MLKSLSIKNFILIKNANVEFKKGFNVLCGETGAGKSIIIKALDCVLGAKIEKTMILDSKNPCYIEAVFEKNGVETIISRQTAAQSKFRIDGVLVSLDEIKELKNSLVDIHSQHQTYYYMAQKHHIKLLDDYITKTNPEYLDLLKTYKSTYLEFREVEKKLEFLRENYQNNQKEIDFLNFQLKELNDAQIRQNEEEEIQAELNILSNIQVLKDDSYSCYYALSGDNQNIIEALGKIKYNLSNLVELDKNLEEPLNSLFDSLEGLKDTANYLRDYSSSLEYNPQRLDELNERIALIQKLKRKYGADLDEVYTDLEQKLKQLTNGDNNIEVVEKNFDSLSSEVEFLSSKISDYRKKHALSLSKLIEEKLKNLELKEAKFEISVELDKNNELGKNKVEFLISTNKNKTPLPLAKSASGGEISRVMLGLKTVFCTVDSCSTVVFDEIDTGISGITSNAVAQSIVELSQSTQIISITHQPIIAAKADNFIWVEKNHKETTEISIEILNKKRKIEALAQIASGEVSQKTLDFASTLVD